MIAILQASDSDDSKTQSAATEIAPSTTTKPRKRKRERGKFDTSSSESEPDHKDDAVDDAVKLHRKPLPDTNSDGDGHEEETARASATTSDKADKIAQSKAVIASS